MLFIPIGGGSYGLSTKLLPDYNAVQGGMGNCPASYDETTDTVRSIKTRGEVWPLAMVRLSAIILGLRHGSNTVKRCAARYCTVRRCAVGHWETRSNAAPSNAMPSKVVRLTRDPLRGALFVKVESLWQYYAVKCKSVDGIN